MKKTHLYAAMTVLLSLGVVSCASSSTVVAKAVATMEPRSDSNVRGVVTFMEYEDGRVAVRADLENVPPGLHGFHVHETGDCSAPDATSAGGHFNPWGNPHGGPEATTHHVGDLGNVRAGANGVVSTTVWSSDLSVSAGPASVEGKAVILHADPDDLVSQPTGAAGGRIACGVISRVDRSD